MPNKPCRLREALAQSRQDRESSTQASVVWESCLGKFVLQEVHLLLLLRLAPWICNAGLRSNHKRIHLVLDEPFASPKAECPPGPEGQATQQAHNSKASQAPHHTSNNGSSIVVTCQHPGAIQELQLVSWLHGLDWQCLNEAPNPQKHGVGGRHTQPFASQWDHQLSCCNEWLEV